MDKVVATVSTLGQAKILNEQFMPYDMYILRKLYHSERP